MNYSKIMIVVVALVAVSICGVNATPPQPSCQLFDNCADCACRTFDYDVSDSCQTGCAWLPSSGACVTDSVANGTANAVYSLFPHYIGDSRESREAAVDNDRLLCELAYGKGTLATVIIVPTFGLLVVVLSCVLGCKFENTSKSYEGTSNTWLLRILRAHIPSGDRVMWEGVASRPHGDVKDTVGGLHCVAMLSMCALGVPSFVWMCIGLPTQVDTDWSFGFYYPICFVGGLATLGNLIFLPIMCTQLGEPTLRSAYAVTDKHAMIVTGDQRTKQLGERGSVKCHAIGAQVTYVGIERGSTIVFSTSVQTDNNNPNNASVANNNNNGGAQRHGAAFNGRIKFPHLADTGPLFALLQARSGGGSTGTVVGVPVVTKGGSEPPTGGDTGAGDVTVSMVGAGAGNDGGSAHSGESLEPRGVIGQEVELVPRGGGSSNNNGAAPVVGYHAL